MKKLGIFGGTFSPPHIGHIQAAGFFLKECKLDELLIMPAFIPPHKQSVQGDRPEERLALTRAAFEKLSDRIHVSDFEIVKAGVSYTAETLAHYASDETELYFLCGTDMFLSLDTWYHPERIFALATVVCALRYEDETDRVKVKEKAREFKKKYGAKTKILRGRPVTISSTAIREALGRGEDVSAWVTPEVQALIREKNSYV